MTAALIGAVAALLIACGGWYREYRKDKTTSQQAAERARRSDLDVLLNGFELLVNTSTAQLSAVDRQRVENLKRALECEEREEKIKTEMKAMQIRLDALEGAIGGY